MEDDDDMESFSDEIATDYRHNIIATSNNNNIINTTRKLGNYRELDYYMEKIVEIQEQLAS